MGTLMYDPAFGGQTVLVPDPFYMDQGALPLAKDEMLEG
jgi:hypothetical protein